MNQPEKPVTVPDEIVLRKIYMIRDQKVMLDRDLAELYDVETKYLKRAVKRNISRFPNDFMFELTEKELSDLRCQIGTSSWGGARYSPLAFTEQGVAMLSSVLSSERAITVNIQIIRIFTRMRQLLSTHKEILHKLEQVEKKDMEHDEKLLLIFDYLKQLEQAKQDQQEFKNRRSIGFRQGEKE